MRALNSIVVILFLTGCAIHQELINTSQARMPVDDSLQDWFGSDLKSLPVYYNPKALAEIAEALCTRPAPFGQKVYALRLAELANTEDRNNKYVGTVLSRVAFFVADSIDNDEDKVKKSAEIGVKAARSVGLSEENPEACFFFALNQGLIVKSKGLFALNKLPEIHNALKIAQKVESIDFGGPLRVLGMMYLKAPAWPSGIGDLDRALELLQQAIVKYPIHPQNFAFYAEALVEDDNKEKALQNLDIAYRLAVPEIWGVYYSKKWRAEIDALRKKIEK
jgi:tetratricopeptide (TPR) repeat protein